MASEPQERSSYSARVVVFTRPDCADCFNVKRYLDMRGMAYTVRDISDQGVIDEMLGLPEPGSYTTPITMMGDHVSIGFSANKEHLEHVLTHTGL